MNIKQKTRLVKRLFMRQSNYIKLKDIAVKTRLSIKDVYRIIIEMRDKGYFGYLSSRPGPKGGYKYSRKKNRNYFNTIKWNTNWRSSMNIVPVRSPIL